MSKGIPTIYNGLRFRSRLEATWAAFFDLIEWPWQYEPFDCNGWIPDFVLQFTFPVLIEVKPIATLEESNQYFEKIVASNPPYEVAVIGVGPIQRFEDIALGRVVSNGGDYLLGDCHKCGNWTPYVKRNKHCKFCHQNAELDVPEENGSAIFDHDWPEAKNLVQWRGVGNGS